MKTPAINHHRSNPDESPQEVITESASPSVVTRLLLDWREGKEEALAQLTPVYGRPLKDSFLAHNAPKALKSGKRHLDINFVLDSNKISDLPFTMRDGYDLPTDVFLARLPGYGADRAIILRTPYNKSGVAASKVSKWVPYGYIGVVQDSRGKAVLPNVPDDVLRSDAWGSSEWAVVNQDGFDTIEWLN